MKAIPNYPGYFATEDGHIWSEKTGRFLSECVYDKPGHVLVIVIRNGKRSTPKVHRLILETFVGPCPKGMVTRHLNGNGSDNRLVNLVWGTQADNRRDQIRHGTYHRPSTRGDRNCNAKLTWAQVEALRAEYAAGGVSESQIARKYGVAASSIHRIVTNQTWVRKAMIQAVADHRMQD